MSWDVCLGKKKPVEVDCHTDGGTYAIGGTDEAELNITYNYSQFYYDALDKKEGLRWLNDRTAYECCDRLKKAIDKLGINRDNDYWKATSGNAGYALNILHKWAKQYPRAKFIVE